MNKKENLGYRADIDGLRAVAVLSVIFFHAFPAVLPGGFIGVDIFFVISGYLITGIILKQQDLNDFSVARFYENRIKRIFPALICILLFCVVFGGLLLLSSEFKMLGKHVGFGSIYLSNFALQREAGYFDISSDLKPLLHLWSLAIEEQFYLVWPLLLILAMRINLNALSIITLCMLASFAIDVKFIASKPSEVFFYPISRVWELLIGSMLVYFDLYKRQRLAEGLARISLRYSETKINGLNNIISGIGCVFILVCLLYLSRDLAYPGWWAVLPVIGAAFVIAGGPNSLISRTTLSNKYSVYLGKISYPLYLWHWPILSFLRIVSSKEPSGLWRLFALLISMILAGLTFKYIEGNIRYKKSRYISFGLLLFLLLIGGIGFSIYNKDGFPGRYPSEELLANDFEWNSKNLFSDEICQKKYGTEFSQYCKIYDANQPPTIAIVGDSTSNHFFPGLSVKLAKSHENLLNLGRGVCPPLLGVKIYYSSEGDRNCEESVKQIYESIIDANTIHTVVLAFSESSYMNRGKDMIYSENTKITKSLDILEISMRNTLKMLLAEKKRVIVTLGVPDLDFDPKECVDLRPLHIFKELNNETCEMSKSKIEKKYFDYKEMLYKILKDYPQVEEWNASEVLCDMEKCIAKMDGRALYRDSGHLSQFGSNYLARGFTFSK